MSGFNWNKIDKLKEKPEQICKDCKNFRQYYIKYSADVYHPLTYGHCVKSPRNRRFEYDLACGRWEPNEKFIRAK